MDIYTLGYGLDIVRLQCDRSWNKVKKQEMGIWLKVCIHCCSLNIDLWIVDMNIYYIYFRIWICDSCNYEYSATEIEMRWRSRRWESGSFSAFTAVPLILIYGLIVDIDMYFRKWTYDAMKIVMQQKLIWGEEAGDENLGHSLHPLLFR